MFPITMSPTAESRTLFFMTSLQYHCILGLSERKTLHSSAKVKVKYAGCAGKKKSLQVGLIQAGLSIKIQGLFKDFPTVFQGLKFMKNTDLSVKIQLQKCLSEIMEK